MNFWEKVKKDIEKEFKAGIAFLREGAAAVKKKTKEATGEGKKQYNIFELKTKVQEQMAALGGRVYDLSTKVENPFKDKRVTAMVSRMRKLEAQIAKLEDGGKKPLKKKTVKRIKTSGGKIVSK
ncbi:MAG: hypothetical protein L6290_09935 [Thermodesulfovibrionales bacterium]|nr:hypothetical protein [Thermodesulfovibrionales bacterium]